MRRFVVLVMIGYFLVGCNIQLGHPNSFWNSVCQPPCWENITPGVTTKSEVLEILSNLPAVGQSIIDDNKPYEGFDDSLHFSLNKYTVGFAFILDDKVSLLSFEYKLDLTLQDAMELFGTPKSILIIYAGEFDAVSLVNPPKGIAFGYRFHLDESDVIRADNKIDIVIFFDPKKYQLLLDTSILSYHQLSTDESLKRMRPWEGYGTIEQYSATLTP